MIVCQCMNIRDTEIRAATATSGAEPGVETSRVEHDDDDDD